MTGRIDQTTQHASRTTRTGPGASAMPRRNESNREVPELLRRCQESNSKLDLMVVRSAVVGVDLDGVLGNQVDGVLSRENARLGTTVTYEQVVHWDLPLGDTSFVPAIGAAMRDPGYVLEMPVHEGAREMLAELRERYVVKILTVRPPEVIALTEEWLATNALVYDDLVPAKEALKSSHGADALIDDYAGNIAEFLMQSDGIAVLVAQPWNQDVDALMPWLGGPRLTRLSRLSDVAAYLHEALASRRT